MPRSAASGACAMRLNRRAQPSLRLLVLDAFALVELIEPSAHLGAERRIVVERRPEQIDQHGLRLAVRFNGELDDATFEFGWKVQRHLDSSMIPV